VDKLSIVIPVYNEEDALSETISVFEDLLKTNPNAEVIFIDDGSTDKSADILSRLSVPGIRVITHGKNKGYGASLKTGVKNAKYDSVCITDADGSYPNDDITALYDTFNKENADMVVGARTGAFVDKGVLRKTTKSLLKKLAEVMSGETILDFNSGFRIFRKELAMRALKYLPDGFSFTTTITLYLLSNNHKITYVPIDYYQRKGKSKIRPIKDSLNFLQLIIRTVMFFNPLKVFLPLSLLFLFLSFAVLLISYLMGRVMDITTIVLFVMGIQLLALGLLADLIDKRLGK
jgi:glycosyltransferase involved in cell wall biosynthesis